MLVCFGRNPEAVGVAENALVAVRHSTADEDHNFLAGLRGDEKRVVVEVLSPPTAAPE